MQQKKQSPPKSLLATCNTVDIEQKRFVVGRNPWLCFPFELLEVVTTHLMWNSAATYAGQLAPPGLLATLIGFAGALHYSFGKSPLRSGISGEYFMCRISLTISLKKKF